MQTSITGYTILKELHQSPQSSIFQALQEESQKPVLVKTINREYPSKEEIARFRNEYQIIRNLDAIGIVKALDLVKHGNKLTLVLEDTGGKLLSSYISNGVSLTLFFTIAIKLAVILDAIHQKRIIHRNINPANILWNPATEEVKVMDFENSTELTREQKNDHIPKLMEAFLPYISPEQTGRMNRDVDYLTDYYSLGATYYEMLTGQHAFEAEDTMGWIYCHITKIPVDPGKLNPDIPKMVSDIVLKLMAKNPENRYQSIQGLIKDLVRCQHQWAKNRSIHQFPLGEEDYSDKFQIPQKLYGREDETEALMSAFQKAAEGKTELLMIAGTSGIGKSALVSEIRIPILQNRGYFIEGENDQLKRNLPYSAITMAFQGLFRRLLAEPNDRLEDWRLSLQEALEPNAKLILDVIPELEKIIGPQPPVQSLNPTEAHNRFLITFRKFIRVFATKDHPLVLFLDDLQWTDVSTMDLITDLIRQEDQHLLVIGAYRNNEVNDSHPLMMSLDEIQKSKFIKRLFLKPLLEDSVTSLIKDSLHCSTEQAEPLANLIFLKTSGNPFFVKELLKELFKDNYIRFDHENGRWTWDLDNIRGLQVSDNVVRFVINRIKRLPEDTQKVLQLASCIGNSFELKTLGLISEQNLPETAQSLWEAIKQGILIPLDDRYRLIQSQETNGSGEAFSDFGVRYKFSHDRIQQAFYSLIDEYQKRIVHLSIGRLMIKGYAAAEIEQKLVDILFQLNEGCSLIVDEEEQYELASLNLTAGKKAKASTAYQSAYQYLKTGMKCLPKHHWSEQYQLTFDLAKEYSECAYLCGEFKEADEQCIILLKHAKTKLEKAEILRMQSMQYTIRGESEAAIDIGIEALALLGVKLSSNPGRPFIVRELLAARFNLGSRKIADLANQPTSTDSTIRTILKMLIELGAPAYLIGRERLFAATVLKGMNLILKHGNTPEAPMCYVPYGLLLASVVGDRKAGYEFGKLGIELNDRFNNLELKSKVIFFYTMFVHSWNQPWRSITPLLKKAIEAGYQSGDLFYLAYSSMHVILWDPDMDLETSIRQGEKYLAVIKESKYEDAWYSAKIIQQMRLNLRGLTHDLFSLNTATFNEIAYLNRNKEVGFVPGFALYHLYKLQICYLYEDYNSANFHSREAKKPVITMFGMPYTVEYCLFSFLAIAAAYANMESSKKTRSWRPLKKHYNQMKKWADQCSENFSHHLLLMEAELARLTDRHQDAVDYYNKAIAATQTNGFIRYEALTNELTAKYFLAQKQEKIAATYMRDALYCYNQWGAIAKVTQLKKDYARLFVRGEFAEKQTEIVHEVVTESNGESTVDHSAETLDLNTISKASQTLSGEVVLEKLLQKLMYIVRENAGAEKVILILKEEGTGQLLIQAESIGNSSTVVMQFQPLEQNENLSASIVQYVARSFENVVLKDATIQGDFVHDVYISNHQPKSLLSMPIINQGILVGVLYLENNLTANAFTPDRLNVLGLLSSQAAISIQNALLYRTMEQKVVERTREITELLDNTGQGFLTFDEDFRIHKQYSRACELFFGKVLVDKDLNQEKGVDFVELIVKDTKEQTQLKKLFEAVLSEKVSLEAIVQFFPEEITIEHRILSLDYKFIPSSQPGLQNRIMVILTDVTREKELAEQLEKDEERNTTILQIVKDRQGYLSFMKSFTSAFRNIEVILKKPPEDIDVDKLFRLFHTIKGGSANFALNLLVEQAHAIESILYNVRAGEVKLDIDLIYKIKLKAIQMEQDFRHLSTDFGNFIPEEDTVYMESIYKIPHSKIVRHQEFLLKNFGSESIEPIQSSINEICKQPIKTVLRGFEISAQSLARELGKKVKIETSGEKTEILFDRLNHLLSSFVHLVRNSIDHGLEPPEERKKNGKSEMGTIKIEVSETEGQLHFLFEDDGRGIDEERIADIALEKKLVSKDWIEKASRQEKLDLVFSPGFSSKKEISHLSGRGVGMDVVKAVVEELSGTIELSTELGRGSKIKICIPSE